MDNLTNKTYFQQILKKHDFTFKKSLGQNFLTDSNILNKIVDEAGIDQHTGVIEIGPGIGTLTERLAEKAGKVVAIEIDQRLIPVLNETLNNFENIKIIHGDVLKVSLNEIIAEEFNNFPSVKVVANLPYYITSPIIIKLLKEGLNIDSITVMVQKEVAERISAKPGGKDYGSLTLFMEYYSEPRILFTVPSSVFIPKPNVDSAIIHLNIRKEPPIIVDDEELLFKIIKASFAQRRKTLLNNLLHNLIGKEKKEELYKILVSAGIDPNRRAETLSLEEYSKLTILIKKSFISKKNIDNTIVPLL